MSGIRTDAGRLAILLAASVIGTSVVLRAQSAPLPTFAVASIKINRSGTRMTNFDIQPGGRFVATNVPLAILIRIAYGESAPLSPDRLIAEDRWIGAKGFLEAAHYDVEAKADGEPSQQHVLLMLRALLADRFRLVVHREVREKPSYLLLVASQDRGLGPRLRTAVNPRCAQDESGHAVADSDFAPTCRGLRSVPGKASGRSVSIADLGKAISGWVDDHRPVVDNTQLDGLFDFDLDWMPTQPLPLDAPAVPSPAPDAPSLFTALQEQLGLKLEPSRDRIDVLVVDHAEQPTPN